MKSPWLVPHAVLPAPILLGVLAAWIPLSAPVMMGVATTVAVYAGLLMLAELDDLEPARSY